MTTLQDVLEGKEVKLEKPKLVRTQEEHKKALRKLDNHEISLLDYSDDKKTNKKLIIACNRHLSFNEMVLLNKIYSTMVFKYAYHGKKNINTLLFECLIIDITDKQSFTWLNKNIDEIRTDKYLYVNLAIDGKHLSNDDVQKMKSIYNFDRIIKRLPTGNQINKTIDYMFEIGDHLSQPQNGCVDGIFRLISNHKKKNKKKA